MRADVGILHEGLADRQKQTVQRNGIRHFGRPTDGAEQNGVEAAERIDAVWWHHRTGLLVQGAGPGKGRSGERETGMPGDGGKDLPGGIGHVLTDTVPWDECDRIGFH